MADKFIFDGPNKCISGREDAVVSGVFSFSIYELYSEWKRWCMEDDNLKYLPAFRTIGGDPIGAGQYVGFYLFLRNDLGWCGRPPNVNPVTVMVDGSFFGESPNLPVMSMIPGNTTSLVINRSALTMGIDLGGGGAPTALEIASAVWGHSDGEQVVSDASFAKDIEGGKWEIVGTQMIFYKDDNTTEIARYNLFDVNGTPSATDVYKRERV